MSTANGMSERSSGRLAPVGEPSRWSRLRNRLTPTPGRQLRTTWVVWGLALAVAVGMSVCRVLEVGPGWFDRAAAVVVATAYTFALANRVGGRPWVFGTLAAAIGAVAVVTSIPELEAGASVMSASVTGALAVLATVPANRFLRAAREVLVALVVAAVGAVGVVGFRPEVDAERFAYTALAVGFLLTLLLVYRLGAGLQGLGRRGVVTVLGGGLVIAVLLAYAELLRSYGPPEVLDAVFDGVRWTRDHLGAVPRPIQVVVGIPALVWGTHMRARRRQGWWVCAFGVAFTVSVAGLLVNPVTGWTEALLIVGYSVVPGLLLGWLAIRLDLLLTGPRGRRARREEERTAARPEPPRFAALR